MVCPSKMESTSQRRSRDIASLVLRDFNRHTSAKAWAKVSCALHQWTALFGQKLICDHDQKGLTPTVWLVLKCGHIRFVAS